MSTETTDTTTESNERGPLEVPRLKGEALKFVQTLLALGMPYQNAVAAFLTSFPAYAENNYLTEAEVAEILRKRFKHMRGNSQRASYHAIKKNKENLKAFLDVIPIASPLIRLIELEQMRQDPGLKCEQRLKVLMAAAKEQERLMPRDRVSPFSPLPNLPDLTKQQQKGTPSDPFGGAMMSVSKQENDDDDDME